jgi:ParB-like chromosome segregation protein Spo0J
MRPENVAALQRIIADEIATGDLVDRVAALNEARALLHAASPFAGEPVDYVRWELAENVQGNTWNPNVVAPPEMELLRLSIDADGYTQPIVAHQEGDHLEVVDGFHRHRIGKEYPAIGARVHGHLPVVQIRTGREDTADRMASTIRHNRARGKHTVVAMQDIVVELRRRNWSNEKIGKQLGMDADEVLRLCQMTGLAGLFTDDEFSASWDIDDLSASDDEALAEVAALTEGM